MNFNGDSRQLLGEVIEVRLIRQVSLLALFHCLDYTLVETAIDEKVKANFIKTQRWRPVISPITKRYGCKQMGGYPNFTNVYSSYHLQTKQSLLFGRKSEIFIFYKGICQILLDLFLREEPHYR